MHKTPALFLAFLNIFTFHNKSMMNNVGSFWDNNSSSKYLYNFDISKVCN